MARTIRVAARRSRLALAQAAEIGRQLGERSRCPWELVPTATEGDLLAGSVVGTTQTGVFVGAVRRALEEGRADIAVHSLKDLPTTAPRGIVVASVPPRVDPRDAVVSRDGSVDPDSAAHWAGALPAGARVGTGSPRRAAQLRRLRPDVEVVAIRGNVDSRVSRVREGDLDAVIVAAAGLERLGIDGPNWIPIPIADMLPAPGQGALAVEATVIALESDPQLAADLTALECPDGRAATSAERSVLATLEAGCSAPVGAFAEVRGFGDSRVIHLDAGVFSMPGIDESESRDCSLQAIGPASEPEALGEQLARELLVSGAATLLEEHTS